jgi:hypothetical protein
LLRPATSSGFLARYRSQASRAPLFAHRIHADQYGVMPDRSRAETEILEDQHGPPRDKLRGHRGQRGRQLVGQQTAPPYGAQHFRLQASAQFRRVNLRGKRGRRRRKTGRAEQRREGSRTALERFLREERRIRQLDDAIGSRQIRHIRQSFAGSRTGRQDKGEQQHARPWPVVVRLS